MTDANSAWAASAPHRHETSQRLTGLLITKLKDVAVQEDCVKENVSSGRASTRLGGVMRVERGLT